MRERESIVLFFCVWGEGSFEDLFGLFGSILVLEQKTKKII